MANNPILIAVTGASGALYSLRLIEMLLKSDRSVDLLLSDPARVVIKQECGLELQGDGESVVKAVLAFLKLPAIDSLDNIKSKRLQHFALKDWISPVASGSGGGRDMVICPCSMGTLARVRHGISENLIERGADVTIKEQGRLIMVPRESPFSPIHLENMLALSRLGVIMLPAAPGFYNRPQTVAELIDFIVGRILDRLEITHDLNPAWPNIAKV
ncbi:MAG: UbiX family flavin prenyltransferase [Magnetococcales bacterium]|nr:UbiX family flavin prenyltransferase [Magnetococcales bacterium]